MKRNHSYAVMMVAAMMMAACDGQDPDVGGRHERETVTVRFTAQQWNEPETIVMGMRGGGAATRASLEADGKALTDFWLLDYLDGTLVSQVHQTSSEADFAEPAVQMDYGSHTLYFIASRGTGPTLSTADKTIRWEKPLDTFYKKVMLTVSAETSQEQEVSLERIVTKLSVTVTDAVPEGVTSLSVAPHTWYHGFGYESLQAVAPQTDAPRAVAISESHYNRPNAISLGIYGFCPQDGYETDVSLRATDGSGATVGEVTIAGAPMVVNRVSKYAGQLFSKGTAFGLTISPEWSQDYEGSW